MSYLNQAQDARSRVAAIAGVTAIHAALGFGLVVGLTVTGFIQEKDVWDPFTITPDPLPKPPPPETRQPPHQTEDSFITVPPRPLDLSVNDAEIVTSDRIVETDQFVIDVRPVIEPTIEPPRSAFAPRGARPSNSQARWITNDDYPARALRDEAEGIAAYRLIVGTSGQVSACEVTRSTGNGPLDDATCDFIQRRARFKAATDETGAKVIGSYTGTVRWDIPE